MLSASRAVTLAKGKEWLSSTLHKEDSTQEARMRESWLVNRRHDNVATGRGGSGVDGSHQIRHLNPLEMGKYLFSLKVGG